MDQRRREDWHSIGLSGGGAIYTPAISPHDPDLIIVSCDMGGAYRSVNGGRTWQMIHHAYFTGSTRCSPVFHPVDPDVVYAVDGARGDLRVSRDRGETWSPIGEGIPGGLMRLAIEPGDGDFMLASTDEGVYWSVDAGRRWDRSEGVKGSGVGFHIGRTSPPGRRRCFAATEQGIFRSDDDGATWEQIGEGLPQQKLLAFVGASDGEGNECVLYCSVEPADIDGRYIGGVYRSKDFGLTWRTTMGSGIETDTINLGRGRKRLPAYPFLLAVDARPLIVYAARQHLPQVFRSDDGGDSWRPLLFYLPRMKGYNVEPNYITAEMGGWPGVLCGAAANPLDPEQVIATEGMWCAMTRDGGTTWRTLHTRRAEGQGPVPGRRQSWVNTGLSVAVAWHYYVDPFEAKRHYINYTDLGYASSTDAGRTWRWHWGQPLRNTTYELAFDPESPGKMWMAVADQQEVPTYNVISGRHYKPNAGGGVGVSEDFGVTWKDSSQGLPGKSVTSIVVDPRSPKAARVLYASVFEGGVFKSADGGNTWTSKSEGLGGPDRNMRACRLALHPDGTLFVLVTALAKASRSCRTGTGLYRSCDGANTWEWVNRSQPLQWPLDFDVDPRNSRIFYLGAGDLSGLTDGGLYGTSDGGQTWRRMARNGPETFGATVHPTRPGWVYMTLCEAAPGPGLWLSKDGGETWKPFLGLPFRNILRVHFDPVDDAIIYVTTFGGGVFRGPAEE